MRESVLPDVAILEERFITASGPGGQNVNKVATAVQLRIDVYALGLSIHAYKRLRTLAGTKINAAGELVITARNHRTQDANRTDARDRAAALIERAHERQAYRVKTKPSRRAKAKRVDAKKNRSKVKAARGKVRLD